MKKFLEEMLIVYPDNPDIDVIQSTVSYPDIDVIQSTVSYLFSKRMYSGW